RASPRIMARTRFAESIRRAAWNTSATNSAARSAVSIDLRPCVQAPEHELNHARVEVAAAAARAPRELPARALQRSRLHHEMRVVGARPATRRAPGHRARRYDRAALTAATAAAGQHAARDLAHVQRLGGRLWGPPKLRPES